MEEKKKNRNQYLNEWRKEHTTWLRVLLNNNTDADILEHLQKQENRQGYIKALIRADIKK